MAQMKNESKFHQDRVLMFSCQNLFPSMGQEETKRMALILLFRSPLFIYFPYFALWITYISFPYTPGLYFKAYY